MVRRLSAGVAPGGTLFMVGHRPIDPATGAETTAASVSLQISVDAATTALDPERWTLLVAEDRPRPMARSGVDAVVCPRRRNSRRRLKVDTAPSTLTYSISSVDVAAAGMVRWDKVSAPRGADRPLPCGTG